MKIFKPILKSNMSCKKNSLYSISEMIKLRNERVIRNYKSSRAYVLNDILRNNDFKALPKEIQQEANSLSKAISSLPKYNNHVWRRIDLNLMEQSNGIDYVRNFLNNHSAGKIVKYDSFTSTSKDFDGHPIESNFKAVFRIKSKNGRDLTGFPGVKGENEVLFDKGTSFKINASGVHDGDFWVDMEEI